MIKILQHIVLYLMLLTGITLHAQDEMGGGAVAYIKKGDRFFRKHDYSNAIKQYEKAQKLNTKNTILRLKLADTYRLNHDLKNAEIWYKTVIDTIKPLPYENYLNYYKVLTHNGKYDQAEFWLAYYHQHTGGNDYTTKQLNFFKNRAYFKEHSEKYSLKPASFNSSMSEFSPLITNEGIIIVSNREAREEHHEQKHYYELYMVKFSSDSLTKSVIPLFKNQRYHYHDGSATFAQGKLIFTRTPKHGANKDKLRIFETSRDSNNNWVEPKPLNLFENGVSEGHPTISSDGQTLYFVSDIGGNKDIYVSTFTDKWGYPVLLSGEINSDGDELFPFLHNDTTLYFASNGHPGFGGLDLFKMTLTGVDSGQVINLGEPINSSRDDFGLTLSESGDFGYISSAREGGFGLDDIYQIGSRERDLVYMEGFTKGGDKSSSSNLGNVLIYDQLTNRNLGKSDDNGFFKVQLENDKEYSFSLKALDKQGYEAEAEYYEIAFEGLIKNKIDTNHLVQLTITDALSGDTVYKKGEDQLFTYFILEKEKNYNFQASTREESKVELTDIEFEGFIKGTKEPVIISEMEVVDKQTNMRLFKSDANGYFRFPMKSGKSYTIMPQSHIVKKIDIWMEGYMKVPDGEFVPPVLYVQNIVGEHYEFQNYTGYFGFPVKEGDAYLMKSTPPDLKKDYQVANKLQFVGFAQDSESPVALGKVKVYNSGSEQLLFETDESGFFTFDLEPNVKYQFIARQELNDGTVSHIKFDGVVKDQGDSLTYAKLSIMDLETNKQIVKQNSEGFFNFELEENKAYGVQARAIPIKKDVLQEVNLLAFAANDIFKQVLIQDVHSSTIYQVNLVDGQYYYTDGVVNRKFNSKSTQEAYDLNTVSNLLNEEGWILKDTAIYESIYYEYNSHQLADFAKQKLDVLAKFMIRYPQVKLVVSSHADARGTSDYNLRLTDKRNLEVIAYLATKGIGEHQIKAVSNGDLESLQRCEICSEKDHELNRRTDFHVISF